MTVTTHDYRKERRCYGHSIAGWKSDDDGHNASVCGWGYGVRVGDLLQLGSKGSPSTYIVEEVSYYADPGDMWRARLRWVGAEPPKQPWWAKAWGWLAGRMR